MTFGEDLGIALIAVVGVIIGLIGSYLFQHSFEQRKERYRVKEKIADCLTTYLELSQKQLYAHYRNIPLDEANIIGFERIKAAPKVKSLIILYFKNDEDKIAFQLTYNDINDIINQTAVDKGFSNETYLRENGNITDNGTDLFKILADCDIKL